MLIKSVNVLFALFLWSGYSQAMDGKIAQEDPTKSSPPMLRDIVQTYISNHLDLFDCQTIQSTLPWPVKKDLRRKRQLPIHPPALTRDVLLSLANTSKWKDSWGYVWQIQSGHDCLYTLIDQEITPNFTLTAGDNHTYTYEGCYFYIDFDPVDYVETATSSFGHISFILA